MIDNQQFIRIVQDTDASALLTIYEYYVQHTAITFEYIAPKPSEFAERINITLQKFPWLVYIADNQILGYAYANVFRYREAYDWSVESSVYVHHETQSKGIGKILYQTLFEILELQGFVNVIGGITLPNEKSENLHSSFGFRKVGIFENVGYKFEQWHSIVFYEKAINLHAKTLEKPFLFTQIRHTEEFSTILKNVNLKLIHNS